MIIRTALFIFFNMICSLALAEVNRVTVTGEATVTGASLKTLKTRAIYDALQIFMLQNGVDISSKTLMHNGKIQYDQLILNSRHSVLGFDILEEKKELDKLKVTLKIFYGKLEHNIKCDRSNQFTFNLSIQSQHRGGRKPPYLLNLEPYFRQSLLHSARKVNLSISQSPAELHVGGLFDYNSIVTSQIGKKIDQQEKLFVSIDTITDSETHEMKALFHFRSENYTFDSYLKDVSSSVSLYDRDPLTFFQSTPKPPNSVLNELTAPAIHAIIEASREASCSTQTGLIEQKNGKYQLKIKNFTGVNENSIFLMTKGRLAGFHVVKLEDGIAHLAPLQGTITTEDLTGEAVYLVE